MNSVPSNTQLDYTVSPGMFQVLHSKGRVPRVTKGRSSMPSKRKDVEARSYAIHSMNEGLSMARVWW